MKTKSLSRIAFLLCVMVMACAFFSSCSEGDSYSSEGDWTGKTTMDFEYQTLPCKTLAVEISKLNNVGVQSRAALDNPEGDVSITSTHQIPVEYWPKGQKENKKTVYAEYKGTMTVQFFGFSKARYAGDNIFFTAEPKVSNLPGDLNSRIWDFKNRKITAVFTEEEIPSEVKVTIGDGDDKEVIKLTSLCKNAISDIVFNKAKSESSTTDKDEDFINTMNKLVFDLHLEEADPEKSLFIKTQLYIATNGIDPNIPDDNVEVIKITENTGNHGCDRDTTRNEAALLSDMTWYYHTTLSMSDGSKKDSIFEAKTEASLKNIPQTLPMKKINSLAEYKPTVTLFKVGEEISNSRQISLAIDDDPLQFTSSWSKFTAKVGKVERPMTTYGYYDGINRSENEDYVVETENGKKYNYYIAFRSSFNDKKMPQLFHVMRPLEISSAEDFILKVLEGNHSLSRDTTRTNTRLMSTVKGKLEMINVWNSGKKDTVYVDRKNVNSFLNYNVSLTPFNSLIVPEKYVGNNATSRIGDISETGTYQLRLLVGDDDVVFECSADTLMYGDKKLVIFPHYSEVKVFSQGSYYNSEDGYYYYRCVAYHSIKDGKNQEFFLKRKFPNVGPGEDFIIKYKEGLNHTAARDTSRTASQLISDVTAQLNITRMWNSGKEDYITETRTGIMSRVNYVKNLSSMENVDVKNYTFSEASSRKSSIAADGSYTLSLLVDNDNVVFDCSADTLRIGTTPMVFFPHYSKIELKKSGSYYNANSETYYYRCLAYHTVDGRSQEFFLKRRMTDKKDEIIGWDYISDKLTWTGNDFNSNVKGITRHSDSSKDEETEDNRLLNFSFGNTGDITIFEEPNISQKSGNTSNNAFTDGDWEGNHFSEQNIYTLGGKNVTFTLKVDNTLSFKGVSLKNNPKVTSRRYTFEVKSAENRQGDYLVTVYELKETLVISGETKTSSCLVTEKILSKDEITGWDYMSDKLTWNGSDFNSNVKGITRHSDSSKDEETEDNRLLNFSFGNTGDITIFEKANISKSGNTSNNAFIDGDWKGNHYSEQNIYSLGGKNVTFTVKVDNALSFKGVSLKNNPKVTSRRYTFEVKSPENRQGDYLVTVYELKETLVISGETKTSSCLVTEKILSKDEIIGWDYISDKLSWTGNNFKSAVTGTEKHSDSSKDKETNAERLLNFSYTNSGSITVYSEIGNLNPSLNERNSSFTDGNWTGNRYNGVNTYAIAGTNVTFTLAVDNALKFKNHNLNSPAVTSRTYSLKEKVAEHREGIYLVTVYTLTETSVISGQTVNSSLDVTKKILSLDHTVPGYEVDPEYSNKGGRSLAHNAPRTSYNTFDGVVLRKIDDHSYKAVAAFNVDGTLFKLWEGVNLAGLVNKLGFIYSNSDASGFEPADLKAATGFNGNQYLNGYEWTSLKDGRINTFSPVSTNLSAFPNPWIADMVKVDTYYTIGNNIYY